SLRTIDFLPPLPPKEAIKIQKLFSFILFGRVIKAKALANGFDNEYLDNELTFNFLSELQSLGVLAGVESMGLGTKFKSNDNNTYSFHGIYNDKIIHVTHEDPKKILTFNVLILTPLGHELRSLCPATIDINYINYVVDIIKKQDFKVVIGEKVISSDGSLSYINGVEV
ncbi:DUF2806 domain-containing protein, partial [Citrobacter freundii]|nr:DUF2806 domain-containing protein [Citrobacter freundii]